MLFAGTELGVYVSFDDGDHWQSLQLNLPVTSVRDLVIHGDDLVIATHGRAFWVMDNITPLRQIASGGLMPTQARLFRPAAAVRMDNDTFLGSPFPPEEPMAKNPPSGAVIDYFLPATAGKVTLEVRDTKGKLVRRYVSGEKRIEPAPQLPIADRWLTPPQVLETSTGMHRFVWDLRWSAAGMNEESDDEGIEVAGGPKVAPGSYEVRLKVDNASLNQPLQVKMDPRSKATASELAEQQRLGLEIFEQTWWVRETQTEIKSARESLVKLKKNFKDNPQLQAKIEKISTNIAAIESGSKAGTMGLSAAGGQLQAALRVVESGDRTAPQQALEVYRLADEAAKSRMAEWRALKAGELAELHRAAESAGPSR